VATKTRGRTARRTTRSGGRITGARGMRSARARGRSRQGGRNGLMGQITNMLGRAGSRGTSSGGGMASRATGFVRGFLSGGSQRGRRRR
jgi:hypothetical protein